jgi:Ras-related protein Rab-6A
MNEKSKNIKIAFVGDEGVGKTSIIMRIEQGIFQENLNSTVGMANRQTILKFNNKDPIKISNIDIGGREKNDLTLKYAIKDASGIVLVSCVNNSGFSSDDLKANWLNSIRKYAPQDVILALVLNKSDLLKENKEYNKDSVKEFAEKINAMYFVTSALKNEGITELYEGLIRKIKGWNTNVKLVIKEKKENEIENVQKNRIYFPDWRCCY